MALLRIQNLTTGKYFQSNPGSWLKTEEEIAFIKQYANNPRDLEQPTDPSVVLWTDNTSKAPEYDTEHPCDQEAIENVLKTMRYLFPNDSIETV